MVAFSMALRLRKFSAILLVNHDYLKKKILSFSIVQRKLFRMDIALVNDVNLVVLRYLMQNGSIISKHILMKISQNHSRYKSLRMIVTEARIICTEHLSGLRQLRPLPISRTFGLIMQNSNCFIPTNPLKLSEKCPAFQIPLIFLPLLKDILACRQRNFDLHNNKNLI